MKCYHRRNPSAVRRGVRLAGRPWRGVACVVGLAGLLAGLRERRRLGAGRRPVQFSDSRSARLTRSRPCSPRPSARLERGLAAADEGHLDRARAEFDRAVDVLLSYPGGALAEPRVAEAYRRTLDTIQVREIEMLAAGDGFTEAGTEPASIDAVADLPVGDAPASPGTHGPGGGRGRGGEPRPADRAQRGRALLHRPLPGAAARLVRDGPLARAEVPARTSARCSPRRASRRTSPTSRSSRAPSRPTAYSRAKAKGVWQFISATGKRYGLAVDWWVDERSDPEKATRAAARYLKDLYELFGDWNLALAGYNAGEGKVLRAMTRYRTDDFWKLRKTRGLRRETKNYVPLIHAAIVIAKAPERYGFTVTPDEAPDFERVPIEGAFDLRVIAECAGEPVEEIRALNPELRRLATPADRTFALRVPAGRAQDRGRRASPSCRPRSG